jgi:hypothetical protein
MFIPESFFCKTTSLSYISTDMQIEEPVNTSIIQFKSKNLKTKKTNGVTSGVQKAEEPGSPLSESRRQRMSQFQKKFTLPLLFHSVSSADWMVPIHIGDSGSSL